MRQKPQSSPAQDARCSWICVLLAVLLLSLPNVLVIFKSEDAGLAKILLLQGIALVLLPMALGWRVRSVFLVWLPVTLLIPVTSAYVHVTGFQPNEWAVLTLLESSGDELASFAFAALVIAGLSLLILAIAWWLISRGISAELRLKKSMRCLVVVGVMVLPLHEFCTLGWEFGWKPSAQRLSLIFPYGLGFSFVNAVQERSKLADRSHLMTSFTAEPGKTSAASEERQIHLLVLGETCRFDNFSRHGYHRQTSPRLDKCEGLLDFTDVVSPGSYTSLSVPMILTNTEPGTHKLAASAPSILQVFRKAGYRVVWLSTQKKTGFCDTSSSLYAKDADQAMFLSGAVDPSSTGSYSTVLDSEIVLEVEKALSQGDSKLLIVCHTMGSHSNYAERYPENFGQYPVDRAACPVARKKPNLSKEDLVNLQNAYDNSIAFTDQVLGSLIDLLEKQSNAATSFCYIADHGENSGDALTLPFAHGVNTVDVLHVPMFMWFSEGYRKLHPQKCELLKARQNIPFGSAHLFHTLTDLADITSSLLVSENSLCHPGYQIKPRTVAGGAGKEVLDYEQDILSQGARKGWRPLSRK